MARSARSAHMMAAPAIQGHDGIVRVLQQRAVPR
jgi:hypothetical protein